MRIKRCLFIFVRLCAFCAFLWLWNLFVKKTKKFKTALMTSSIKSGLLDVVVFCKLNSKCNTRFAWDFTKTCLLFHFSWHHITLRPNRVCSFAHARVITISALLCLSRYSQLANIFHQAKRCCTVSCCSLHNLHSLFSVSPLTSFQALVSTICFVIEIMADVFLGVKFCLSHISHFLSCFFCIFDFVFPFSCTVRAFFPHYHF